MNSIGVAIVWCVLQVTLLGVAAIAAYALARRLGPPVRGLVAFTGLAIIIALSTIAFSPWPRWSIGSRNDADQSTIAADAPTEATSAAIASSEDGTATADKAAGPKAPQSSSVALIFQALADELQHSAVSTATTGWRWPAALAAIVLIAVVLGIARLGLGIAAVRAYRQQTRAVADADLRELVDVLQAELGCARPIELRESELLVTAATVGWRRPLILLPAGWRQWSAQERRTVLAHEIAHIQRHDFLTWACAQFALVLHFYHPLVHWLCGRLRLEQELAADAAAARVAGGQRAYLTTLAGMALRQADRPLAWPARTFLPTRGTFLRRIEMLRDAKPFSTIPSARARVGTIAALLAIGLAVAGLRGAAGPAQNALAGLFQGGGAGGGAADNSKNTPFSLDWVPRDAFVVAAARPAAILAQPIVAPTARGLLKDDPFKKNLGAGLDRIEQVIAVMFVENDPQGSTSPRMGAVIVHTVAASDADAIAKAIMTDGEEQDFAGMKYLKSKSPRGHALYRAGDRTLIFSEEEGPMRRVLAMGKKDPAKSPLSEQWARVAGQDVAVHVNVDAVRGFLDKDFERTPPEQRALIGTFSPLWQNSKSFVAGISVGERITLQGYAATGSAGDARKVQETMSALVTLARNALSQARQAGSRLPGPEAAAKLVLADMADSFLDTLKIESQGNDVSLAAGVASDEATKLVALVVPAATQARTAARRAQAMNNLKQICLAMHNYASVNDSFPPAVLYGPDGKTPYSWRVAILPYLEQEQLFRQYNFNEPWDSAGNKQVLAKMPAVFRDPSVPADSTSASYFVLTGPDTVFSGKDGTKFAAITDGTSNTLMIVEAKRDIPWTRPDDIPYAADKAVPKLGGFYEGGFHAAICDGSVRFLADTIPEQLLRALITKSGGEVVGGF